MRAEGLDGPVPRMPFTELCDLIAGAIKSIPAETVIKTFKQTLFSLPADGSKDEEEGSKRLLKLIAKAPSFDDLPPEYKSKVTFQNFIS